MKIKEFVKLIIQGVCVLVGISGKFYLDSKINKLNSGLESFKKFSNDNFARKETFDFKNIVTKEGNNIHRLLLKEFLRKYRYVLNKNYDIPKDYINKYPNRIWVFWDSGFEKAPEIVKICLKNIEKHSSGRIVEKLDINNVTKYINLPDYIWQKFKEGKIDKAVFADIIRTVLLRDYGGMWIDATVYLSGDIPDYIFNVELFSSVNDEFNAAFDKKEKFFKLRSYKVIGNYFMSVKEPNNYFFKCMSEFFFEYWKEMEGSDYNLWYAFAAISAEEDPKICNMMYKLYQNKQAKTGKEIWRIQTYLNEPFNQSEWDKLKKAFPVHKFSAKYFMGLKIKPGTFADKLLKGELK